MVQSRVTAFWSDHHQFGYLKWKSSLAELLSCYHHWCLTRNSSKATDVIFLDLSKAFDRVPHECLLHKLNRHGIDNPLLLWFINSLKNRQQRVTIRGTYTNWSPVTTGVPQGTILAPPLFLLNVNDISNVVTSSIKMFADDTKIYREINNAEDTLALQSDLDFLENWTKSWQVKFNPQKCEVMRITHKQDKSKRPYHLSNAELKSVNSCKDLGVDVSRDWSWSNHVDAIVNNADIVVGLQKRTVGSKNREIFSMLYKSLVRPILEYAFPVWSPYLVKDSLALEKVRRRALRIALSQKLCKMSYEEWGMLLNWNTLQHRRECLSVVECYKTVFGLNGLDLDDYFEFCRSKNSRANHPFKIQTKLAKVNSFRYSFFVRIVKKWNSLLNHLFRDEINLNKFPKALKDGWRFIDIEAYVLILYIFILNTIFTYRFLPVLLIFTCVFYNFLIFLKFS